MQEEQSEGLVLVDTSPKYEELMFRIDDIHSYHSLNKHLQNGWCVKHMSPWGEDALVCIWKESP